MCAKGVVLPSRARVYHHVPQNRRHNFCQKAVFWSSSSNYLAQQSVSPGKCGSKTVASSFHHLPEIVHRSERLLF